MVETNCADYCDKSPTYEENEKNGKVKYEMQLKYGNITAFVIFHLLFAYGVYIVFTQTMWQTIVFSFFLYWFSGFGGTAGAHRLWTHRSYKATLQLRLLLTFFNSICYIGSIYDWVRDHRIHHKYSETDADPHNAMRGFFFAHCGWLMCKKHPEVIRRGRECDMNDIKADKIVMFQHKYYWPVTLFCCFGLPMLACHYGWNESWLVGFMVPGIVRWILQLHAIFLVNSAAHLWGRKPYDKYINPAENFFVSAFVGGEGFHNYHHTFPYDYATSELGWVFNPSKTFIDVMAAIGWAYDLKTVSPEAIRQRKQRTGDIHEKGAYGPYN